MEIVETLAKFLDIVSGVTGISANDIMSKSHREDITLARKLFINIALKYGFSTLTLALTLRRTKEGIRKLYISSLADEETRKLYRAYYQQINNKLKELNLDKTD